MARGRCATESGVLVAIAGCGCGCTARIGRIEPRPLEHNWHRTENATSLSAAFRAGSSRPILETLPHVELVLAAITLVRVSRHLSSSCVGTGAVNQRRIRLFLLVGFVLSVDVVLGLIEHLLSRYQVFRFLYL